jgi:hypothetical protein
MAYLIGNNVLTTLHTTITGASTSIIVDVPAAPNKVPVSPNAGNIATLTLVDQIVSPTIIEIITYTSATNNGDGTYTLTGVTRGTEGTAAQAFTSGAICFQALTAATFNSVASLGLNTLLQFCGDGSDGNATVTTPIIMTTDSYYLNLTISGSGSINTNGYTLYVSGVLDLSAAAAGAIFAPSGANASGTAPGAGGTTSGVAGVTVPTGFSGGAGGSGGAIGSNGGSSAAVIGGMGGNGGSSSAGSGGFSGGFAGGLNTFTDVRRPGAPLVFFAGSSVSPIGGGCGGAGGGGGTLALTAGGGGGGGGCGLTLYAGTIVTSASTPAAVIKGGIGGNGGNGGTNGGGCGGGGGGGPVIVGYGVRVGPTITNGIRTQGGSAGSGGTGTGGPANAGGGSGAIHVYNLLTGTGVTVFRALGANANNAAGGVGNANL